MGNTSSPTCTLCDYPLSGLTPDAECYMRCPECGTEQEPFSADRRPGPPEFFIRCCAPCLLACGFFVLSCRLVHPEIAGMVLVGAASVGVHRGRPERNGEADVAETVVPGVVRESCGWWWVHDRDVVVDQSALTVLMGGVSLVAPRCARARLRGVSRKCSEPVCTGGRGRFAPLTPGCQPAALRAEGLTCDHSMLGEHRSSPRRRTR